MKKPSGSTGLNQIEMMLKKFIGRAISKEFPRQAVAPDFNLYDLLIGAAVDPFPLRDKSADESVVPLYRSLLPKYFGLFCLKSYQSGTF